KTSPRQERSQTKANLVAAYASPPTPSSPRSGRSVGAMALRALVGKLRVLPARAPASRCFASQMEKKCSKCGHEVQAGSFYEMMEEATRRDMEEIARYKRRSYVARVLGTVGTVGFVAFSMSCVADALVDDSY
ncbi:unnamed protein product, partial [Urochloa humidicola]